MEHDTPTPLLTRNAKQRADYTIKLFRGRNLYATQGPFLHTAKRSFSQLAGGDRRIDSRRRQ